MISNKFWRNRKLLVTGGAGFLGGYVLKDLMRRGVKKSDIIVPRSRDFDLRMQKNCKKVVGGIDIVIHLAANVGGIGYNRENPGSLFYDNLMIGAQLMEEARKAGVKKFVAIGTVCAYPKYTPVPFKEEYLWDGYPEETNAPYGLAKKMLLVQAQAYRVQYDFNAIYLLPVNLYGPGDNFDLESSHVIPALIKKFYEAKVKNIESVMVWGSGKPTREFLYVEDAARGIILAAERYNKPEPVNLGSSYEISIGNLAKLVGSTVNYKGKIVFDKTQPNGQLRRKLNISKAKKEFGFTSRMPFIKGLKKTVRWYETTRKTKKT